MKTSTQIFVMTALAAASFVAGAQQGSTQSIPIPASSAYSGGWANVAITVPTLPGNICTSTNNLCYTGSYKPVIPDQGGASGSLCGSASNYTDSNSVSTNVPCQGYPVIYRPQYLVNVPAADAYCSEWNDQTTCYPAQPAYQYTAYAAVTGSCPQGFSLISTGSSGAYQYYSCAKQ